MLTLNEIFKIIAGEAANGCTDEVTTVDYFHKYYGVEKVDMRNVRLIAHVIDFDKLRAMQTEVYEMFPLFE